MKFKAMIWIFLLCVTSILFTACDTATDQEDQENGNQVQQQNGDSDAGGVPFAAPGNAPEPPSE